MTGGALSNDLANLPRIVAALRAGGVVLLPTDTVLGLATLPNIQAGVDRLYALKDRPRAKALPIMVATSEQLADLGVSLTPTIEQALASPFVPGALTDRKSTRLNSSHVEISYAVFCLKKKVFLFQILKLESMFTACLSQSGKKSIKNNYFSLSLGNNSTKLQGLWLISN